MTVNVDVTTMENTVFRRDGIWFVAENAKNESEIRRENNEYIK